jgi:hypothetical protein
VTARALAREHPVPLPEALGDFVVPATDDAAVLAVALASAGHDADESALVKEADEALAQAQPAFLQLGEAFVLLHHHSHYSR